MTDHLLQLLAIKNEWSAIGWVVLVLAVAATQVVLIPRAAMSLAAGALYGAAIIPLVAVGTALGAVAAFLLARHVASKPARRLLERRPRLKRILDAVDAEGWRLVAVSRCGVPIPASFVNYTFGLTNVGLWPFTWATFAFCIPQAALFVCLGAAGRNMIVADSGGESLWLLSLGVVSSALAVYLVSSRLRALPQSSAASAPTAD